MSIDLEAARWRFQSLIDEPQDSERGTWTHEYLVRIAEDALALAEAVDASHRQTRELREAWRDFGGVLDHSGHCFRRTAAAGWSPGQDPVIVCECGLDRLEATVENLVALAEGRPKWEIALGAERLMPTVEEPTA